MARKTLWFVMVVVACGGGGGATVDVGGGTDLGRDAGRDVGGCLVKEDCPPRPCHLAACVAGACEYQVVPAGAACQDPERCIVAGSCDDQGVCQGPWACEDNNPCTKDECAWGQCSHTPLEGEPCDDGNPCTRPDMCVSGECNPGPNQCACETDGDCPMPTDLCLGRLMCDPETHECVPDPEAKKTCPPSDRACHESRCEPQTGECVDVVLPDGTACDLGKCFKDAACKNGECQGTPQCTADGPCKVATCEEDAAEPQGYRCTIRNAEDGAPCDDGNACTPDDRCQGGQCLGGPAPEESCNGLDDDCDGYTDPENSNGCKKYYHDNDGDGYGDEAKGKCLCAPLGKYTLLQGGDCNDQDPAIRPGAVETCNERDDDCDGQTDEEGAQNCKNYLKDQDADGYGAAGDAKCLCGPAGDHVTLQGGDCDDGNATVHPGTPEACNGADDNCNGQTDEGEGGAGCTLWYRDSDGDGYGSSESRCLCGSSGQYTVTNHDDCNDTDKNIHPGAVEACNAKDDNCNSQTDEGEGGAGCTLWYRDSDKDGYGSMDAKCLCGSSGQYTVTNHDDCNDTDKNIHPGAVEACNAKDDNCNSQTDEGEGGAGCTLWYRDSDKDGYGSTDAKCLCGSSGQYTVTNHDDCNDTDKNIHPGVVEACNAKDDNCNSQTDEGEDLEGCKSYYVDADGDTYGAGAPKCLCQAQGSYVTTKGGDCAPDDPTIHPGAHVCAKDGDCDGKLPDVGEPCDDGNTVTWDGCDANCAIGEFQVNSYYLQDQRNPDVAFAGALGTNGYFVAWEGVGCTKWIPAGYPPQLVCAETDDGVWLNRFDAAGKSMTIQLVNTYLEGTQRNPAVCGTAYGAVVVWEGQGSASEADEVYARRFLSDGTPKDNFATRVNPVTTGVQRNPDVVCNDNLAFRVVWETPSGSGGTAILLRAFTENLAAWDEETVNTLSTKYHNHAKVAYYDKLTRFVVVWQVAAQAGQEDVYGRRYLWNTAALDSQEFRVNDFTTGSQREPSVAGNPASGGGFVVVWAGLGTGGSDDDIWARVFHHDGTPNGPAFRVNSQTTGVQTQPDVAVASDGSFVVVWNSYQDIYIRRFKADKTPVGTESLVNRYLTNTQAQPALTGASDGIVLVAWESQNQDESGFGIFAQRFGANGERLFR